MNVNAILTALLIPFAGTALGSAFVFFMKKEIPNPLQKALLGFASGVMVAASVWSLLIPSMEMSVGKVWPAVIGLLGGFAGQMGDLFASLVKRHCKLKDYSNLFPGHGGMLDRLDSVLFMAVLMYCYRLFFMTV